MIFFKVIKEKIKLLEYENIMLRRELEEIKKQLKPIKPFGPFLRMIREDGYDTSYETLKHKYRKP